MTQLNQLLGVRKSVNSMAGKTFVEIGREVQKPQLMAGLTRNYAPLNDDGDRLPGEFQKVQNTVAELNDRLIATLIRLYDVNATVDEANTGARGTITWSGGVIEDVPVTTLMWLDKQLAEVASYLRVVPVLDPAFDWEYDEAAGVYKTQKQETHRTTKVQKPIVLYPATEKHAAQTQLVIEDELTGYWTSQKLSGAIPIDELRGSQARLEELREAVIKAREAANDYTVENVSIGAQIMSWVFA